MSYEPNSYWTTRAKSWVGGSVQEELKNLLDCIEKYVIVGEPILDVGSGDGHVLEFLLKNYDDEIDYKMCDMVDGMRDKCEARMGIKPDKWDGVTLPYGNNTFELVISMSVMLHIIPQDISRIISEHRRVSSKYLFIATWYCPSESPYTGVHCFQHDYYELFEQHGLKIVQEYETFRRSGVPRRRNWLLEKS